MHLPVTDRARTLAVTIPGAAGTARARTRQIGDVRLRMVDYAPGYVADRWCAKGHVVYVVAGELTIEHQDNGRCMYSPPA